MQLLSLEQWISTVFVKALGATFLHSIWQALIALIVCHIVLAVTKRSSPAVRYNLLLVVAASFVVTSFITFALQFQQADNVSRTVVIHPALQYIVGGSLPETAPVLAKWQTFTSAAISFFDQYADVFITVWFIIFSYKCLQLSLSIGYVKRITSYGSEAVGKEWMTMFGSLREKLNVDKKILLLQSDIIKVPMTAGFFKPVIIVPMSMLANLPPELVESILLHELAHIKRRDYLVNLIQSFVETTFFFNPFVWKISSLIKDEREACCDSVAVEVIENKVTYVNALVAFGEYSTSRSVLDNVVQLLLNNSVNGNFKIMIYALAVDIGRKSEKRLFVHRAKSAKQVAE